MNIYIATSNGDFNNKTTSNDTQLIQWELEVGQQKYIIVTRKKLTEKQYTKIVNILEK